MANPISQALVTGTVGELLVQLRLLQFGVQAASPIKDSGNDLVALKGYKVRTIQVKCSAGGVPRIRNLPERYHILALVQLAGEGNELLLDRSIIHLIPRRDVGRLERPGADALEPYLLSERHVEQLFSTPWEF